MAGPVRRGVADPGLGARRSGINVSGATKLCVCCALGDTLVVSNPHKFRLLPKPKPMDGGEPSADLGDLAADLGDLAGDLGDLTGDLGDVAGE